MSKLTRSLVLMTAMAVLSTGAITIAQEKGKGTAPTAKATKPDAKAEKAGSIEYYKNAKGKWRYIIKDEDGKSIAMPLAQISYDSKDECLKAIDFLKKTLNEAKPTERKEEKK